MTKSSYHSLPETPLSLSKNSSRPTGNLSTLPPYGTQEDLQGQREYLRALDNAESYPEERVKEKFTLAKDTVGRRDGAWDEMNVVTANYFFSGPRKKKAGKGAKVFRDKVKK